MEPKSSPDGAAERRLFSRTFNALRYRDFRLLWAGAFTSTTGSWMQQVAQSWLVFSLTGSAFYLGLTSFLGQLPVILFSLLGGAFADRLDRRKLLLCSQYVQMFSALVLTVLVFSGWIHIWHFLVLVFVAGTGQAFGGPAYQALIPGLVNRKDVPNAIALNSIQFNLARTLGPLLAGITLASVGAGFCFALNSLSFLAAIVALCWIKVNFVPPKTRHSILTEIGSGFRFVRNLGALWQLTLLGFVSTFCGIPLITLLPAFASEVFKAQSVDYSIMMAVSGAGSVLGALLYATFSSMERRGIFTLRVQFLFALLLAGFALSRNLLLSYVILFTGGACLISLFASITSLVQLATTEEMRGRVMSIFVLAFRGGMPLGDLVAGFLASQFSLSLSLLILSLLLGSVSLGFLFSRSGVKTL
ncbi:MAG: MFS transporter [Acidobacteriota bacterium]